MRRFLPLLALAVAVAGTAEAATLNEDIIVTGQRAPQPGANVWFENGFSEFPALGPQFAKGLVIWNHPMGAIGQGVSVSTGKPIGGLAALGWDVIRLQRNPRLPPAWENRLDEVRATLVQQIAAARTAGYQRIILAGQGFGGALALETAKSVGDLYGVIALAPNTGDAGSVDRTWSQLREAHAQRMVVLFPTDDDQVTQPRGAGARNILGTRQDLSFVLVDENSGVRGNAAADSLAFSPYATCMGYFFAPEAAPHKGEFHCGADEIPAALARMGAHPQRDGWFGYSNRGLETFIELPAGSGPLLYGTGYGAAGLGKPAVTSYTPHAIGNGFAFDLNKDLTVRGLKRDNELRLTVDLADGTRSSVLLRRLSGGS